MTDEPTLASPVDGTSPLGQLPSRDHQDEERFLAAWRAAGAESQELLVDVITAAMDTRRPLLAARLVGLLDDEAESDAPAVARARAAAGLLLKSAESIDPVLLEDFMDAWRRSRADYMARARKRQRARAGQERPRQPRRR